MRTTDLLTDAQLRQALLEGFIAMARTSGGALARHNLHMALGAGMMAFVLLLAPVKAVLVDVIDAAGGHRAARHFEGRLCRAAGVALGIASIAAWLAASSAR